MKSTERLLDLMLEGLAGVAVGAMAIIILFMSPLLIIGWLVAFILRRCGFHNELILPRRDEPKPVPPKDGNSLPAHKFDRSTNLTSQETENP